MKIMHGIVANETQNFDWGRVRVSASGDAYDLAGVTALSCCFLNDDGTELSLALGSGITIIQAAAGKLVLELTAAQTALLAVTDHETLELSITKVGDPVKLQIQDAYSVKASEC